MTWKVEVDHLRCTPEFNKQPRYDCVMLQTDDGRIFTQLKFAFTVLINETLVPIVLVQAFDRRQDPKFCKKDEDLGLIRLQQRSPQNSEIFFARSIIRGAVIFSAYDNDKDFMVFDIVDPDMFLRCKES